MSQTLYTLNKLFLENHVVYEMIRKNIADRPRRRKDAICMPDGKAGIQTDNLTSKVHYW
jgi:hypothetical protein